MQETLVWQVFVPRFSNDGKEFSIEYHKIWDEKVRAIAGGITICRTTKGHWVNPEGKLFVEEMIPVIIFCTEDQIKEIADMTLEYYNQEAVAAYLISSQLIIRRKSNN